MSIIYHTHKTNVQNHLLALAPIAYYLRNEKLFSWNKILEIINFKHFYPTQNKPALIRVTKQYAKFHNLEPPISHHARKNMFITYNLVALGMPLKDIHRFQADQYHHHKKIHDRIKSLSQELSIPNPLKQPSSPNPEPAIFENPSLTFNYFNTPKRYFVTVHTSRLVKLPHFLKRTPTSLLTHGKHKPFRLLNPILSKKQLGSALEKAHHALYLAVKHKMPLKDIAFSLGFSSASSLIQCLNIQLAKCEPPIKLSHKDFIPSP